MNVYRNKTEHQILIPNVGLIEPGAQFETEQELNHVTIEPVKAKEPKAKDDKEETK